MRTPDLTFGVPCSVLKIMANQCLFGYLKHYLKVMLYLGVFPWKCHERNQTLEVLDWKLHTAIMLSNYIVWSLPFDLHYFPYIITVFRDIATHSEIKYDTLFEFIMRRISSIIFYIALPMVHHLTCLTLRQKFCLFFKTNQSKLESFKITWTITSSRSWCVFGFLLAPCVIFSFLYCNATVFVVMLINDKERIGFPIAFGVMKVFQSLLYMVAIIPIILEISSAFLAWIESLKAKIQKVELEELVEPTFHECLELIQACQDLRELFPKYLHWMVMVGLLNITDSSLHLCEALVRFLTGNPGNEVVAENNSTLEFVVNNVTTLALGMMIVYGIFIPSSRIRQGLQDIQLLIQKTYFPQRLKAQWKGREVPAKFVVKMIIADIQRFQGFVIIGSKTVVIWFFTFFLFFLQFGIQPPEEQRDNSTNTCNSTDTY